ncbi:MAG: hypothetical protein HY713_00710 [candidate division NC10 bacterium]|nr:hypothetical protein [candidate division NC10 bacterium]
MKQWVQRFQVAIVLLIVLFVGMVIGTTIGTTVGTVWAQARAVELVGSFPFVRLVGREASGRTWEMREAAGVLTLYNATSGTANLSLGGTPNGGLGLYALTYSALGTAGAGTNGVVAYCSDCTIASPCNSGGTGALAKGLNATWVCN